MSAWRGRRVPGRGSSRISTEPGGISRWFSELWTIPRVKKDGEAFYPEIEIGDKEKSGIEHEQVVALAAEGRLLLGTEHPMAICRFQGDLAERVMNEGLRVPRYITCQLALIAGRVGKSPWDAVKEYVFE